MSSLVATVLRSGVQFCSSQNNWRVSLLLVLKSHNAIGWTQPKTGKPHKIQFRSAYQIILGNKEETSNQFREQENRTPHSPGGPQTGKVSSQDLVRGCLHDTRSTFAPERVHSSSLSWLYICLHDTTTKCHAGASHPSVSSPRLLYLSENSLRHEISQRYHVNAKRPHTFRYEIGLPVDWNG